MVPAPKCCGSEIAPSYVVDHESTPDMLTENESTPGMLYGERIHPWYAKDHESTLGMPRITNLLFCGETVGFGKKSAWDKIIEKSLDHEKPGEWESKKKTFKNPRKIKFFFWPQHSPDFRWSNFFSMKLEKSKKMKTNILWRPVVCWGERCYATENDSTPGMLRSTNPPLVCYGSRIHPWYMLRITNPPLVC